MRSYVPITVLFALAGVLPVCAGATHFQQGDLFLCRGSQFHALRVSEGQRPDLGDMVRRGLASWAPPVLDAATSHAMAEGRGLWGHVRPTALFESLGTRTPPQVMAAVALGESGRSGRFWPWTINVAGESHYFGTKSEAVDFAQRLIRSDVLGFDVGLMQVHWKLNSQRFTGIEEAFEPAANARVADEIIQEHLRAKGSMSEAVGRYHSKTPSLKTRYLQRVAHQARRVASYQDVVLDKLCKQ